MLTRLRVKGFKNLVDVDVHFGPFTCVAGANGVGKSNLFDAIRFLSALTDKTFVEAAKSVRDEAGRTGNVRSLFNRVAHHTNKRMEFVVEMIVPRSGTDDLGQPAGVKATFLQYKLELGLRSGGDRSEAGDLELLYEDLRYIKTADAKHALPFPNAKSWRDSTFAFSKRKSPFISTEGEGDDRKVYVHQEAVQGRRAAWVARQLPRTLVSAANASEGQTSLLARREMQSWRLLQLESTALRNVDEVTAPPRLSPDGSHLPATLYRLARESARDRKLEGAIDESVYERVATRLHQLIREIRRVDVDYDEKRELLTLMATDSRGTRFAARDLSDGTLRFLALSVLELDPGGRGLICFEEPENGIHPARITAIMQLLKDIAVDATLPVGPGNPLQQVIVNTHSPGVVGEVDANDLLYAESREQKGADGQWQTGVTFKFPADTWRREYWERVDGKGPPPTVSPGKIKAYLAPVRSAPAAPEATSEVKPVGNGKAKGERAQRVADRSEYRHLFSDVGDGT